MEVLKVCLTAIGSIIVLFLLTKLMGNKQMSELSMFDYIIGISIGSIAAEMATDLEHFWNPLIAMTIYAVIATVFSYCCSGSIKFRRFGFGKTLMLYRNGKLFRENLKKAKLDLNELLVRCRSSGYFDLSQLSAIMLEPNGKISFLPYSSRRPATPADMQLVPPEDPLLYTVILDGKILFENLEAAGHTEHWLRDQLKTQNIKDASSVFLGVCDKTQLTVYKNDEIPGTEDIFE